MKQLVSIRSIIGISLILSLVSCSGPERKPTEEKIEQAKKSNWVKESVAYEIFVQSFVDSDGDGIGDIPGMTSKLDYLQDLGIKAVWLMPIMPSPSYHKYDVTDYLGIHPDYGTMEDFKAFVAEAHRRDIKVIIDLIINHTSSEHPWFIDAKSGTHAELREYYVWADKDSVAEQIAKKEISFDSDNIRQWHPVGSDTLAEHYYGFFYGGMPDLNHDSQTVREQIYNIGKFWLSEVRVDGFRMDAAKHIFPDDRAADNHAFWIDFKKEMEKINPEVYIVGEVWANTDIQAPYVKGFSALFNFDLAFSMLESIKREKPVVATISGHGWVVDSTRSFVEEIIKNTEIYKTVNQDYVDATFLSNHDQNRVVSVLNNNLDKAKLAAAMLLTLPGTPYIYYGEEIGMRGMKPDPNIREPFLWGTEETTGINTSWIEAEFSTYQTIEPLSSQVEDPNSIYTTYKELIALRTANTALSTGRLQVMPLQNKGAIGYKRIVENQELLIIHNLTRNEVQLKVPNNGGVLLGEEKWIVGGQVFLPGLKTVIIQTK